MPFLIPPIQEQARLSIWKDALKSSVDTVGRRLLNDENWESRVAALWRGYRDLMANWPHLMDIPAGIRPLLMTCDGAVANTQLSRSVYTTAAYHCSGNLEARDHELIWQEAVLNCLRSVFSYLSTRQLYPELEHKLTDMCLGDEVNYVGLRFELLAIWWLLRARCTSVQYKAPPSADIEALWQNDPIGFECVSAHPRPISAYDVNRKLHDIVRGKIHSKSAKKYATHEAVLLFDTTSLFYRGLVLGVPFNGLQCVDVAAKCFREGGVGFGAIVFLSFQRSTNDAGMFAASNHWVSPYAAPRIHGLMAALAQKAYYNVQGSIRPIG